MQQDFFGGPLPPAAPRAVPRPPTPAPRRRGPLTIALLVVPAVSGLLLAMTLRAEALPDVRQVEAPAPAADGWGPSWVDDRGRPVRWDPCAPIGYVVNPGWMPQRGREDLAEALRRISAVSGLSFVDEGDTDELPGRGRPAYQPERYGERWAPVLVAWVPPSATDLGLGGGVQGLASTTAVPTPAGGSLVSAQVALDAERRLASGFGPGATEGEVLLHELAHAVGLGHVDDPTQVMYYRTTNSESEFGAGDRAGLRALGAASGCRPAPAARDLSRR
ncbi:MAG TPA: matrixin family metalloprotease [Mycobacteriales bacterium]|nr:matrixin family metalloprotease [Mycobacteriales bacterium]